MVSSITKTCVLPWVFNVFQLLKQLCCQLDIPLQRSQDHWKMDICRVGRPWSQAASPRLLHHPSCSHYLAKALPKPQELNNIVSLFFPYPHKHTMSTTMSSFIIHLRKEKNFSIQEDVQIYIKYKCQLPMEVGVNEESLCMRATLPFSGLCVIGCAKHNQSFPHRAMVSGGG